ncbi:MAG: hypothetical protein WCD36_09955 [Rhodanobacteraceae bacterium]
MSIVSRMIPMALMAAALVAQAACAADTRPAYQPIRPVSNCLDLSHSPEVYAPSNKLVIVKTGPKYYRIDLANDCGTLNAGTLTFRVAQDKKNMQRMCGELGDQVVNQDGMRCDVSKVTILDEQQFKELEAQSKAR